MEEELKALPNLNSLFAKLKLRELRQQRILQILNDNPDNKTMQEFGDMLKKQAEDLIEAAKLEIAGTREKINAICVKYDAILAEDLK